MTTIIRAGAAHDFLALVPVLAGYRPARSLVCVAFEGNRTTAVLRHDLPDADRADAVATALLGTLCRIPRVDAIVPVAYGDRPFGQGDGMPNRYILDCLARRAEEAGFVVRDALTVAPNGWGSMFDDDLPDEGMPLRLIEESAAVSEASTEVTELAAGLADSAADLVRIAEPDDALAGRIRVILDGLPAPDGRGRGDDETVVDLLERVLGEAVDPLILVERIAAGRGDGSPEELAWLLALADQPPIRDAMMLQAAFGPVVGELAFDSAEDDRLRRDADRGRDASESPDSAPPRAPGEHESVDGFLSRLMLGRSTIRPDVDRVRASLEVLGTAIGNAPIGRRTGALCVAGWLAWALGRGSAAGALIDLALDETPEHTMAGLLHRFLALGELPEWAFSEPLPGAPSATDRAE
ncbi:DUF4192 family protein [Agromyces bracchium]|uniref:DUF4192 family protein n=1 Tax=Agromyces bracchium TaxID=88376 RepID=A0A6I3MES1_9MICO|nr:DUF4192 family protein [Agromyces bracchium]MTH68783.1 DUF4192 family protein [Agromyces bracchium]